MSSLKKDKQNMYKLCFGNLELTTNVDVVLAFMSGRGTINVGIASDLKGLVFQEYPKFEPLCTNVVYGLPVQVKYPFYFNI